MLLLQEALQSVKMAKAVASYDQLAHQVEALRKENSHLRRELEDNSNHLSKLETETTGMKVSLDTPTPKTTTLNTANTTDTQLKDQTAAYFSTYKYI